MSLLYSKLKLPQYAYLPGKMQRALTRTDIPSFEVLPLSLKKWNENEAYLYGIDLFNHGFYYEAHEVWEELWHEVGHKTLPGKFLKILIQLSAIQLKLLSEEPSPAKRLAQRAQALLLELCREIPSSSETYLGIHLKTLSKNLSQKKTTLQVFLPLA